MKTSPSVVLVATVTFLQRRQNQALVEYAYEREELLASVDALSREILALRAQMVSGNVLTQSVPSSRRQSSPSTLTGQHHTRFISLRERCE